MKLLIVAGTIDLKHRLATCQFYWQLMKGLYEQGVDVIVVPYLGEAIESLWWRTYPNPCLRESLVASYFANKYNMTAVKKEGASSLLIDKYIKPKWEHHLLKIIEKEQGVDAVVYLGVPINHLRGIPTLIKKYCGNIPFLYFDADYPSSLPQFYNDKSFRFETYQNSDVQEFDIILSNAVCAVEPLKKMGAKRVEMLLYGVDTDVCSPMEIAKDIDVFYSGIRSAQKEKQMEYMIGEPSSKLDYKFVVGGVNLDHINLGRATKIGILPMPEWRNHICRSRIALNITKEGDSKLYGTSSMRPFELAAMGSCVISDPYEGLSDWFEIGTEMFIVHNAKEACELYQTLLSDSKLLTEVGINARNRVIKSHSTKIRAKQLVSMLKG